MNRTFATGLSSFLLALALLTMAAVAAVLTQSPAFAAPPGNDSFANRTVITALPFTDGPFSTAEATTETDEPLPCGNTKTVWYEFTPGANMTLVADTLGSNHSNALAIYNISPFPNSAELTCSGGGGEHKSWNSSRPPAQRTTSRLVASPATLAAWS